MMEQQILLWIAQLEFLQREARRKKRSKNYKRFVRDMVAGVATAQFGAFSHLKANDLATFEQILDGLVKSMAGKPTLPKMQGKAFVSLQKKIFVPPAKRGPRNLSKYDRAYLLSRQGETVTAIARKMDPEKYQLDPVNTIQKYWRAIERRKQQPSTP